MFFCFPNEVFEFVARSSIGAPALLRCDLSIPLPYEIGYFPTISRSPERSVASLAVSVFY